MTWAKLDDAILDNPKIIRAGPLGFALHVAAITWCARNLTDGFVPEQKSKQLLGVCFTEDRNDDRSVRWTLAATSGHSGMDGDELVTLTLKILFECGLWIPDTDEHGNPGYRINDYLKYNPSRAEVLEERERKRTAGKAGGKQSAIKRAARGQAVGQALAGAPAQAAAQADGQARPKQNSTPVPVPVPVPEEKNPPTPLPDSERPTHIRRFEESFTGTLPHQRADVLRVFERFKQLFGGEDAKLLRGDGRAEIIAEKLDAYDEATCLLVIEHAPADGKVSGKTDERGEKHGTIRYILGNQDAFERILRAARERTGQSARRRPASELAEKARQL